MDSVEFKRRQIKALQVAREAMHGSVLDGFTHSPELDAATKNDPGRKPLRSCPDCDKGMVQGLFTKYECSACHGTGYELDDPIEVIKALIAGGKKLRKLHRELARELREFKVMWTEQEIGEREEKMKRLAEFAHCEKHHSRFD